MYKGLSTGVICAVLQGLLEGAAVDMAFSRPVGFHRSQVSTGPLAFSRRESLGGVELVAEWIHFTLLGIILPTIKLKLHTFWGLMNSATKWNRGGFSSTIGPAQPWICSPAVP